MRLVGEFSVAGLPVPQGSKSGFVTTNKVTGKSRAVVVDKNPVSLKSWRRDVTDAARDAFPATVTGAVAVDVRFALPRGTTVKRSFPSVAPDLDKLVRAVLDALTVARAFEDDSRVVELLARKVYGLPGVTVKLYSMED